MAELGTPSEVTYARNGQIHLAYQTLGEGERDILFRIGGFVPISLAWSYPPLARLLRRMAGLGRLILYDRRGVGLSDPVTMGDAGTTEEVATDLIAVLDACQAQSAILMSEGFHTASLVAAAATRPDRVERLVLINPVVRTQWASDFPLGIKPDAATEAVEQVLHGEVGTPSAQPDDGLADFLDRAGRQGASPGSARAIYDSYGSLDVRDLLPRVTQPTLVLWRPDSPALGHHQAEYAAERIPGARLVATSGRNFFAFAEDTEPLLAEIERFVTGVAGSTDPDRVLRTMLFTDIVGSTERALEVGDEAWRNLLDRHDQVVREALDRFGGAAVNPTGDGILATFPTPSAAIGAAVAMRLALEGIGLSVRFGIHVGEVEQRGDDIGGLGVNLAARVMARANPGDIVVSDAVPPLVRGSGLSFEPLGESELRGIAFPVSLHRLAVHS